MFALVDCNNCYASCERVFQPQYNGVPVVVLSNNDGCIIARSNEAKELGIKMGANYFKVKKELQAQKVKVFSSNYELYGDMSRRVMTILNDFSDEFEMYSIDEGFIKFTGFDKYLDLEKHTQQISKRVLQWTGIPVTVGIGKTKTISKIANKVAKKDKSLNSHFIIWNEKQALQVYKTYDVSDVWGIGRQTVKKLNRIGVYTALDFIKVSDSWVSKNMSITGLKTKQELLGITCYDIETQPPSKKNIGTIKGFGNHITDYETLLSASHEYLNVCALKLRNQKEVCSTLIVSVHSDPFREELPQYRKSIIININEATSDSRKLCKLVTWGMKRIYKQGIHYKRVGIMLSNLRPKESVQKSLFSEPQNQNEIKLAEIVDSMNMKFGKNFIKNGALVKQVDWGLRQNFLSKRYSTNINELMILK